MLELKEAHSQEQLEHIRVLFREYEKSLGFTLDFQDFEKEMTGLPGEYGMPAGRLFLAVWEGEIVGCAGLRKLDADTSEMKRMYVRPAFRGKGIGRALAQLLISEARRIGYKRMRLDTITTMHEAIRLYTSLGFYEIEAYRFNPLPNAHFMELRL